MTPERVDAVADFAGSVRKAAACFRRGGLVVFPTETVYGVGVAAERPEAMGRLREIKRRDGAKPFQRLAADLAMAAALGAVFSPRAERLAEKFWPGPLTLVVPRAPAGDVTCEDAGEATLGIRIPASRWVLEVCRLMHSAVVSSSANAAGLPPALDGEAAWLFAVEAGADLLVDGGSIAGGMASTVARTDGDALQILRRGALAEADLQAVWRGWASS